MNPTSRRRAKAIISHLLPDNDPSPLRHPTSGTQQDSHHLQREGYVVHGRAVSVEDSEWKPTYSNSENARKELVSDLNRVKSVGGENTVVERLPDTLDRLPDTKLTPNDLMLFLKLYVDRIGVPWSDNFGKYLTEKTFQHFGKSKDTMMALQPTEIFAMLDEFVFAPRAKARHPLFVCVFGGGAFGTAAAYVLARKGNYVRILMRKEEIEHVESINTNHINTMAFKDIVLPKSVTATTDPEEALQNVSWIVHAVPVQFSLKFLTEMKPLIPPTIPIISVSKGICLKTLQFMNEIISAALGRDHPTAFMCGPSFARGILSSDPTAVLVASTFPYLARSAQCLLATPDFRVYTSSDVIGVEIGSALKNVLAIAAGLATGLGYGANTATFLVTRGWAEIRKICVAMGAQERTLAGLSGIGDLMLTCFGGESRNAEFGKVLAKTNDVQEALRRAGGVVEGYATAQAAYQLARKHKLELPIITAIADTLAGKITAAEMLCYVMTFTLGPED